MTWTWDGLRVTHVQNPTWDLFCFHKKCDYCKTVLNYYVHCWNTVCMHAHVHRLGQGQNHVFLLQRRIQIVRKMQHCMFLSQITHKLPKTQLMILPQWDIFTTLNEARQVFTLMMYVCLKLELSTGTKQQCLTHQTTTCCMYCN